LLILLTDISSRNEEFALLNNVALCNCPTGQHYAHKQEKTNAFADPFKQFHLHGLSEIIPLACGQFAQWSTKSKCMYICIYVYVHIYISLHMYICIYV